MAFRIVARCRCALLIAIANSLAVVVMAVVVITGCGSLWRIFCCLYFLLLNRCNLHNAEDIVLQAAFGVAVVDVVVIDVVIGVEVFNFVANRCLLRCSCFQRCHY